MKVFVNVLLGIILASIIIGILAYLSMPDMTDYNSFLLGFITCLALISVALLALSLCNGKSKVFKSPQNILIPAIAVVGCLVSMYLIGKQKNLINSHRAFHQKHMEQQSEVIGSIQNSNLMHLMSNILNQIDDELKNNSKRTLTQETINRVVSLSHSFKPYKIINRDSLPEIKLSPERGELLKALIHFRLDSNSMNKILIHSSFAGADLEDADLEDARLPSVDLRGANLKGANLSNVDLHGADLRRTIFWSANLKGVRMIDADLTRADMRWANLDKSELINSDLDGVNLTNAKMRMANLSQVNIQWAKLEGALLNGAKIIEADFFGSDLSRIVLKDANLKKANLRRIKMDEADISGANLNEITVEEEDWFNLLSEWHVTGARDIRQQYKMIDDTTGRTKFQLIALQ